MADNPHSGHRLRMKQQFLRNGLDAFENHQVLELLLFFAIARKDVNELAHELIRRFGSLSQVLDADVADLCAIPGISEHTATLITLCGQIHRRCQQEKVAEIRQFKNYVDIGNFLQAQFAGEKVERTRLLCLNNRGELLHCSVVGEGSIAATEVNLRNIIKIVLQCGATAVVISHNHPAGFAVPSSEDVEITARVREALQVVDVRLLDHIIVADNDYVSMCQSPRYADVFFGEHV